MRDFQDPAKHLQTSTIPLAFQQQHQQSELRVDWNMSNYFLDNSAQGTEYCHLDRPQRQRVSSASTQADGRISRSSLLLPPSDQLPAVLDDLSRHPPLPSNGPSSDPNAMGEMTYLEHMTRYCLEYSMEAFDPSTFPDFPPQSDLSSGKVELSFRHEDDLPYPPDGDFVSSSGYLCDSYQPQLPSFEGQTVLPSTAESSPQCHVSPEQVLKEHTLEDKLKVYQIISTSSKRVEVTSRIGVLVEELGRPHLSQIYEWAFRHRVKLTPASEQRARDRRTGGALFQCLLCDAFLTTNNNLLSESFFSSK